MQFCTEIDLEIVRIMKHVKKTASLFKFRNTERSKKNYSGKQQHFYECAEQNKYLLYPIPIMISMLFITKRYNK